MTEKSIENSINVVQYALLETGYFYNKNMMNYEHTTVSIETFKYAVFEIKYSYNEKTGFFYIGKDGKNLKDAKIYIFIPSWVEMQDLYHKGSEINIQTQRYEINDDKYNFNKILLFCNKIIDSDGQVFIMNKSFLNEIHVKLACYILLLVNFVIREYYTGSELNEEKSKNLAEMCFEYYSAIDRKRRGEKVAIPPAPGIVMLLNICDKFNCTPDVARKINYADIEMMFIAREQEKMSRMML